MFDYPTHYYISSGCGTSNNRLVAFDNALMNAGISNYNLVRVSSILPEQVKRSDRVNLRHGSPLLTAYATVSSDKPGIHLSTAIAVGIPVRDEDIGIIMECEGESASETEDVAREMVQEAMKNHNIAIKDIQCSSVEGIVEHGWLSLVSAVAFWH